TEGTTMKKYFAASAVAIMVFAIAAFAARLNVDAGTLQVGADNDLTCTDGVDVAFTGYEGDLPGSVGGFTGAEITGLEDCEGAEVYLRIFDGDKEVWRSVGDDGIPTAKAGKATY